VAMFKLKSILDTSNFPKDHLLYDSSKKSVLGHMKNEIPPPDRIVNYCAVRPKSYCLVTALDKVSKRAKGVKQAYQRRIKFEDYESVINDIKIFEVNQYNFLSKDHRLRLVEQRKTAFSTAEDKRLTINYPLFSCKLKVTFFSPGTTYVLVTAYHLALLWLKAEGKENAPFARRPTHSTIKCNRRMTLRKK